VSWLGIAAGTGTISAITAGAFVLRLNWAAAAFLHLIVIVLMARHAGFRVAGILSVFAVAGQIYFLVPPVLKWSVADPANWVALGAFEYCALVVSRLSSAAVEQRSSAERQRVETEGLYEASRRVLSMARRSDPGMELPGAIRQIFGCDSVVLFDGKSGRVWSDGEPDAGMRGQARDSYLQENNSVDERAHAWYRVLRAGARPIGSLALRGGVINESLANGLAVLVAVSLERFRAFENESRAEAGRQSEQLRTAVLDALAHDVKTPLTAIRTASSGLLEAGCLTKVQAELVGLIDDESRRINELTERLLRMARVDARDLRPQRTVLPVEVLLRSAMRAAEHRATGRLRKNRGHADGAAVMGDEQLLTTALVQLLDNALRYSEPGSPVEISADENSTGVVLSVHNIGVVIPPSDIERIFERFYRGAGMGRYASGTGLGLAIVRKIVNAHNGRVWVVSDEVRGTTFYVALPKDKGETV
jgi:two-component system sensor histidine kinase KdpD